MLSYKFRKYKQVVSALESERKKLTEIDDKSTKTSETESFLKEKDERIKDLVNEIEILQQHNQELLGLSTKFSKIEQENVELKRKFSDQNSDNQSLKNLLQDEKTNNSALQAANDQLLERLHDLQKNIDLLTIQITVKIFKFNSINYDLFLLTIFIITNFLLLFTIFGF